MEMQDEVDESWSIGQLATSSGLPVRTIRFYSDAGLLPAQRTTAGHRRYAPADLVRLQLIRSLRSLDVDLDTIAELLAEKVGLQDLLIGHASTLRLRLQALQRQLAVAQAAADAPTGRTLARLHALPRIEAAERGQLLERFWDDLLHQVPDGDADWFRVMGIPELPDAPTGAQLDAWLELAELAADPGFRRTATASAAWFWTRTRPDFDPARWQERLNQALDLAHGAAAAGVGPGDPRASPAVEAYVSAHAEAFDEEASPRFTRWLHQQLTDLTDPRAERWWHLVVQIRPTIAAPDRSPSTMTWLHQALGQVHEVSQT